jgi:hypothetical protein
VTARNLTITDSGTGWSGVRWAVEGRGIKVDAAGMGSRVSGVRIEGCSVSGAVSEGVYIGGEAGRVVIKRCVVCDSGLDGVLVTGSGTTTGLSLEASLISANGFGADRRSGVVVNAPNGTGFALIHNTVVDNNLSGLLVWAVLPGSPGNRACSACERPSDRQLPHGVWPREAHCGLQCRE